MPTPEMIVAFKVKRKNHVWFMTLTFLLSIGITIFLFKVTGLINQNPPLDCYLSFSFAITSAVAQIYRPFKIQYRHLELNNL